jgi:hypothetical protein
MGASRAKGETMTHVEYRIEMMPFHENEEVHRSELLAKLNELGKEGWRLVAIDPLHRAGGGWTPATPAPMLLMRVVTG